MLKQNAESRDVLDFSLQNTGRTRYYILKSGRSQIWKYHYTYIIWFSTTQVK